MTRSASKDTNGRCIEFLDSCIRSNPSDQAVGLLLGHLDAFNRITTTFGHDHAKTFVARYMEKLQGVLPERSHLIRFPDRRFAVVAMTDSVADVLELAQLITEEQQPDLLIGDEQLHVDVTMGIAMYPVHADDGATILRRAELALSGAKAKELPFDVYRANATRQIQNLWKMESDLELAIRQGEIEVHYQPQVDVETGAVVGLEALCRWRSNSGMVQPESFVPIAEKTGAIVPMTWQIFEHVKTAVESWGRLPYEVGLSVNITPAVMKDKEFYERVAELRDALAPNNVRLGLEVTEDSLLQSTKKLSKELKELRGKGVDLSLDDFGKGYSSLTHLKNIPATEIKIDRQFVDSLASDESDRQIVKAIVDLGHGLGMKIVAEGVDCVEILETLSDLGCDSAQGFYFSRALPAEHLLSWMRAFNEHPPAPWLREVAANA